MLCPITVRYVPTSTVSVFVQKHYEGLILFRLCFTLPIPFISEASLFLASLSVQQGFLFFFLCFFLPSLPPLLYLLLNLPLFLAQANVAPAEIKLKITSTAVNGGQVCTAG